ncbi:MAG: glycerol-3-phosphate acyltransferase, partial [Lachnospiraceae bacterium]|nr:glycerol-3-phosphate acyltransferase [Lachnospiraceae bacterium]
KEVSEDGNPGLANVYRHCGKKFAIITGCFEYCKGVWPVIIGNNLLDPEKVGMLFGLMIASPVLGHMFSVFHKGKGGIGIAPTCGVMFVEMHWSRTLIILLAIYALNTFVLHYKKKYRKTLTIFVEFILLLPLVEQVPLLRTTYLLISALIIFKVIIMQVLSDRAAESVNT